MRPTIEWRGSVESEEGTATFTVGKKKLTMDFANFRAANDIHRMLSAAYTAGVDNGRNWLGQELVEHMKKEGIEL